MRSREMDLGLLAIIDRQSDHCIRLIGDLRDITRIRAGKVELRLDVLGLEPLMAQVADVVAPVLKSKTQTLEIIPPDTWISVRADGTRLVQILVNVINNASKFSPAGGAIRMSARADERSVEIEIRDWGIGMRPQDIPKIFTRWEQLSESGSGLGLGLGLAVARRLAELHGGTLTAESAGPGEGSEFRLTLPLDPHPSPAGR
jgi:signal transduction histidine kinase